jgi:hypothetical protein
LYHFVYSNSPIIHQTKLCYCILSKTYLILDKVVSCILYRVKLNPCILSICSYQVKLNSYILFTCSKPLLCEMCLFIIYLFGW